MVLVCKGAKQIPSSLPTKLIFNYPITHLLNYPILTALFLKNETNGLDQFRRRVADHAMGALDLRGNPSHL